METAIASPTRLPDQRGYCINKFADIHETRHPDARDGGSLQRFLKSG
jgi:hypothetical protein